MVSTVSSVLFAEVLQSVPETFFFASSQGNILNTMHVGTKRQLSAASVQKYLQKDFRDQYWLNPDVF